MNEPQYIIGVDEAGRGPLAGPVYVGVVSVRSDFDFSKFSHLTDSKLLSSDKRENLYSQLKKETKQDSSIEFTASYTKAETIDKQGINKAIQLAINRGLRRISTLPDNCCVYLDGGLQATAKYSSQKTIIKGDKHEPVISLASIIAKVERDKKMRQQETNYPGFSFGQHKGYPTAKHRKTIEEKGATPIHRQTYI